MSQLKEYKSQNEKIFAETGFFEKYDLGFVSALQLPQGKTTVMHLVPRENLPESNNQGMFSIFNKGNLKAV